MKVSDILQTKGGKLFTVTPDTLLSDCVIQMADDDIGSLVVLEADRVVGILTFREVIRILARRQKELRRGPTPPVAELKVSEVMETKPICTSPEVALTDLRGLLIEHHQRYVPVVDHGQLVGVVSFHDVAKSVYEEKNFENTMLKAYIADWPV